MKSLPVYSASGFIILLVTFFTSCDDLEELDACEGLSLESLQTTNDISEDCKAAISDLLPDPEDNLGDNFVSLGLEKSDGYLTLYFLATESNGDARSVAANELAIMETVNGSSQPVDLTDLEVIIRDSVNFSLSSVLDYSGSMTENDINDGLEIYNDLFPIISLTGQTEMNHLAFSTEVMQVLNFTNSIEPLQFQTSIARESTSLLDGFGIALDGIKNRGNVFRVVILTTDGHENSSSQYTFDDLVTLANENNIFIIALGSLLSDLSFFKELTDQTNTYFIYAREVIDLKAKVLATGALLSSNIQGITIPDNGAEVVEVTFNGKTIAYAVP